MATLTDLVNMALLECGAEPLDADINDATERARACKTAWVFVRPTVLRLHSWNAPDKRALLDPDITAPVWGFATRYAWPSDCLRVLEVDTDQDWRCSGRFIETDHTGDDLGIRYIWDSGASDPSGWDPTLLDTMVLFLAYRVMHRITADKGQRDRIERQVKEFLALAKNIDGQEQSEADLEDDTFVTARY